MSKPRLLIREMTDLYVRENFEKLDRFFTEEPGITGFKRLEIVFTESGTGLKYKHNLNFIPTDLIQTWLQGGTVVWDYASFDVDNLVATVTGATADNPVTIRMFVGAYTGT